MKTNFTFFVRTILLVIIPGMLMAQIPNSGFENWNNNDPVGWSTLDILGDAVSQTTDAHSGSYAAKMEVMSFYESLVPPLLNSFFPISQRYGSLNGYYKFEPQNSGEHLIVAVVLFSKSIILPIGSGTFETDNKASSYSQFSMPIEYWSSETPDSAWIYFTIEDTTENTTAGSYAVIDDLSFGNSTSANLEEEIPSAFVLKQNYPNPFNPTTTIEYSIAEGSNVDLKVYNILGEEVAVLANGFFAAGSYKINFSAKNLPSGIYIATLNASAQSGLTFSKSMKMNLIK